MIRTWRTGVVAALLAIVGLVAAPGAVADDRSFAPQGATGNTASVQVLVTIPEIEPAAQTDAILWWGYKESFRRYVGEQTAALPPIGAADVDERIVLHSPASFNESGASASVNQPAITKPYTFPLDAASVGTTTDLSGIASRKISVQTAGGVQYLFPSHYFDIGFSNVRVVIDGTAATIFADTRSIVTQEFGDYAAGDSTSRATPIATATATWRVASGGTAATVIGTDVRLSVAGAAVLPQSAGDALDDFVLSVAVGRTADDGSEIGQDDETTAPPAAPQNPVSGGSSTGSTTTTTTTTTTTAAAAASGQRFAFIAPTPSLVTAADGAPAQLAFAAVPAVTVGLDTSLIPTMVVPEAVERQRVTLALAAAFLAALAATLAAFSAGWLQLPGRAATVPAAGAPSRGAPR